MSDKWIGKNIESKNLDKYSMVGHLKIEDFDLIAKDII